MGTILSGTCTNLVIEYPYMKIWVCHAEDFKKDLMHIEFYLISIHSRTPMKTNERHSTNVHEVQALINFRFLSFKIHSFLV